MRVGADGRVEFAHPLFASAVYTSASASRRRQTHRDAGGGGRRPGGTRAPHRAVGRRHDEGAALEVESAARRARMRGRARYRRGADGACAPAPPRAQPAGARAPAPSSRSTCTWPVTSRARWRCWKSLRPTAGARRPARPRLLCSPTSSTGAPASRPRSRSPRRRSATRRTELVRARCRGDRDARGDRRAAESGRRRPGRGRAARAGRGRGARRSSQPPSGHACAPTSSSATAWTRRRRSERSRSRRPRRRRRSTRASSFKLGQWLRYVDDFDGARAPARAGRATGA